MVLLLAMLGVEAVAVAADCGTGPLTHGPGAECLANNTAEQHPLLGVPSTFRLQMRVAQAGYPVGDVEFPVLVGSFYAAKSDAQPLCSERFDRAKVVDSVLQLDVGANLVGCQKEDLLANRSELYFKLCINGEANCLDLVRLGAAPMALKATYAAKAEHAHVAERAVVSHYAARAASDSLADGAIDHGYFDFRTPADEAATGGFLCWNPLTDPATSRLNVSAQGSDGSPVALQELLLHAETSVFAGALRIGENLTVQGSLRVEGKGAAPALEVVGGARVVGSVQVGESAVVKGRVVASQGAALADQFAPGKEARLDVIDAHVRFTATDATRESSLTLTDTGIVHSGQLLVVGGLVAEAGSALGGETVLGAAGKKLDVYARADVMARTWASTAGDLTFAGRTLLTGPMTLTGDLLKFAAATQFQDVRVMGESVLGGTKVGSVKPGAAGVATPWKLLGGWSVAGATAFQGDATFNGPVTFAQKPQLPAALLTPKAQSVGHAQLQLQGSACAEGKVLTGLSSHATAECTSSPMLTGAGGIAPGVTFHSGTASLGTASLGSDGTLSLADPAQSGTLTLRADGQVLVLTGGYAVVSTRAQLGESIELLEHDGGGSGKTEKGALSGGIACQSALATTVVGPGETGLATVSCDEGYLAFGGTSSWNSVVLLATGKSKCGSSLDATPEQRSTYCGYIDGAYVCAGQNLDAATYGCLWVEARCCRFPHAESQP
jgi:hypothetical protein